MTNDENFFTQTSNCEENAIKDFKNVYDFISDFLSLYIELLQKASNTDHVYDEQDCAMLFLNNKMIKSFFCLQNLIIKGYYDDAEVISRQIYETIHLCKYIIKDEENAIKWTTGHKFRFTAVGNELNIPEDMHKMYRDLSNFTHSNIQSIFHIYNRDCFKDGNCIISALIYPDYNKNRVSDLFIFQNTLILFALTDFYNYFNKYYWINFDSDNYDEQLVKKISKSLYFNIKWLINKGENERDQVRKWFD